MKNTEWKTEKKLHQNHRNFGRGERLIQHAIEVFDLVDIAPATVAEKTVDHRFLQSDALATVARYSETRSTNLYVDVTHGARAC
ncbi:MAG: hypothetical protein HOB84_13240 [Candidatus Marinimicrobia bacterium]|jgi:hypothetical protein|nr:hypothetical protein [Candidatus Neomarinimicrobiota bacterium]MBT4359902.1 hypothetical protein [Candidatus Neomarinimicrobiota bacterium]MBT4715728.1 hypothetical protein [Candidatus Neomarinimicrobiota bacterium]MBT4947695.1 hypothetical protein [Candidatus Neomarinimicrobiota bacterium]MBT5268756.1 hypothetical protein [Candidatus Neomarinimicrobiota bacterium]